MKSLQDSVQGMGLIDMVLFIDIQIFFKICTTNLKNIL